MHFSSFTISNSYALRGDKILPPFWPDVSQAIEITSIIIAIATSNVGFCKLRLFNF